jgi:hypothetical protein
MFPRLTLLLVIYVALDFSNPLMPGAVSFGAAESVEARHGDRLRGAGVAEAPPPPTAVTRFRPVPLSLTLSRRLAPDVSCVWQVFLRRSYPWLSGSATLSEDA